ncbi:MAG: PhzF family phenazine biosynthesis isomerase [Pseudonocardiaceae bacterium]
MLLNATRTVSSAYDLLVRIRIIDAFTDRPFAGNPAAVCLLDADAWPDEIWMQQVAAEMNLSETAFAYPLSEPADADRALRWFTPTVEVDLCGHATLATAHALRSGRGTPGTVRFSSRSGVLVTHTHDDGTITLDFPIVPATEIPVPDGLADTLNATPDATYGTGTLGDLLGPLLVGAPGPKQPHRAAGVRPHRPGPHSRPRRPRVPDRARHHGPRRHSPSHRRVRTPAPRADPGRISL